MKRTGQQRQIAVFDAYEKTVGGRPCTIEEVVEWGLANGLMPVPTIRWSRESQEAWEQRFAEVTAELQIEIEVQP